MSSSPSSPSNDTDEEVNSVIFNNFIALVTNMTKKIVTVMVSIFIVLTLFVRSYVPGEALYPYEGSRFPYVDPCDDSEKVDIEGISEKVCLKTKLYGVYPSPITPGSPSVFQYSDQEKDVLKSSYDENKYDTMHPDSSYNSIFTPKSMYFMANLYQMFGNWTKKDFTMLKSPLFLSVLSGAKSQMLFNQVLAGLHEGMFRTVKHYKILFFIFVLLITSFIETNIDTQRVQKFLNTLLGSMYDSTTTKAYSISEYILGLIYSIFGGFVTLLNMFKFLVLPIIFIFMYTVATVKTPIPLPISRLLIFSITSSFSALFLFLVINPGIISKMMIAILNVIPYPSFLKTITKELNSFGPFSLIRIPMSILSWIMVVAIGIFSISTFLPVALLSLFNVVDLSYKIGLSYLFDTDLRRLCIKLFKKFSPVIKLIFMIFAIDLIFKVLGKNAMIFALTLFILFFGIDFFSKKGGNDNSSFMDELISKDLDPNSSDFPKIFIRK